MKIYAAYHIDEEIVKKSSSGGAFTAVSDKWKEQHPNAVIYGCILDEKLEAVHIRATNDEDRDAMRGSKYIASNSNGIFEQVRKDIEDSIYVMFSGTPCQVAGLKSYLDYVGVNHEEYLITVEVICHGVGSTKFFHDYIARLEKKYGGRAKKCSFRAKSKPGKKEDMRIDFVNKKTYVSATTKYDWFFSAYMRNYILRPSCYQCKFACMERGADISLSDLWGKIEDGSRTQSLVFVNSEKGSDLLVSCSDRMELCQLKPDEIHQPHIHHASKKPDKYDEFWDRYNKDGFLAAQRFLGNNTIRGKVCANLAYCANKTNLLGVAKKLYKKM